jgi:ACR3 family arsenite efflux pump ArsB
MKTCGINDVAKYLGVPLGTRILSRMKFNNEKGEKVSQTLERISRIRLKIV